jgi:hypothetical protein
MNMPADHVLHGIPMRIKYEDITKALENCYSDHHLAAMFHFELKRRA